MKYFPVIIAVILCFVSNRSFPQRSSLAGTEWLLGRWENQTQRGMMVEQWSKGNDSTYNGKSYMITGNDSVILESIVLKKEGNNIFYIPAVNGQNNNAPVRFEMISRTGNSFVVENAAHDFPQRISYTLVAKDSLVAEISGTLNGTPKKRLFPMKKRG